MLVEISIKEVEHHQALLQSELREIQLAADCLMPLSYRASQDSGLEIDLALLSAHISYLDRHAEWIRNRLSFLSDAAQTAAHLTWIAQESMEEMIHMLSN